MPVSGTRMQERDVAALCYDAGWRDLHLIEAVAVCLSESGGYPHAWHDNLADDGSVKSRDVGLFQINIPADQIGTDSESHLYDPVFNVSVARDYYERRGWQPWYGYTNGYAMATEWWHWSESKQAWVAPGRYLHRAIRGVANFFALKLGVTDPKPFTDYYKLPPKPTVAP